MTCKLYYLTCAKKTLVNFNDEEDDAISLRFENHTLCYKMFFLQLRLGLEYCDHKKSFKWDDDARGHFFDM